MPFTRCIARARQIPAQFDKQDQIDTGKAECEQKVQPRPEHHAIQQFIERFSLLRNVIEQHQGKLTQSVDVPRLPGQSSPTT